MKMQVCNGKKDCYDKSDERDELCKVSVSNEVTNTEPPMAVTVLPSNSTD